jgi:hypothetical protein
VPLLEINLTNMSASRNPITFQKNVTTSGTPVQLTNFAVDTVNGETLVVKAKATNTGIITVGYSSATALNSGSGHFKLAAGEAIEIAVDYSQQVWIDATVSGEGVEGIIG